MCSKEKLAELTEQHIRRYKNMISSGSPHVNKDDASHYLRIWEGIKRKGCDPDGLAPFERAEVHEAIWDEAGADG